MTSEDARMFAENWASPTALTVVGVATVRGKLALRDYWTRAAARVGSLRFTVERVLWDPVAQELAIIYAAEIAGRQRRVSENLVFGPDGLVIRGEVFHGAAV